ncbi:zinc-binding oxidoreductase-like protein CipB [Pseudovirgaria hyperparasitica]|uniref:Zinc-binding oxidoreductase-like protein CipB n=1 Tax=Pseudovirgaria hyperparasitica TaxID=470096 RepID=A0A6A6WCS3_9PEZI|nr:zinc-binding oxidoreductase-like protein CipB [Pseudovirgaria hyperparasitica]KAF2759760.1 zinc-binding oxidoreductase-like protein CipB [Pseudovirgaria hyperparasitica]
MAPQTHTAAVLVDKDTHSFTFEQRATPTPGPNDILIEVHALALNPIDYMQRDRGFPAIDYPSIVGSDIGGIVVAVGSAVPSSYPQPGTRVTAFAPSFYEKGKPDYGAFQKYACVWKEMVTAIPENMGLVEASTLGMATYTAMNGIYTAGLPLDGRYTATDKKALLIWGGSASVGASMVQVARIMGITTYVTASAKNHGFLKTLGASRLFDYKDADVVQQIVAAASEDGLVLKHAYDAAGGTRQILDVLKEFKDGQEPVLASAPASIFKPDSPREPGVAVKFVKCPDEPTERSKHFDYIGQIWLKEKLASGEYGVGSKVELVEGGFESLDKALDTLRAGVSGTKLVIQV